MVAPKTILQGRYEVNEQVGRGGQGAVYRATDLRLRRDVALKQHLLDDEVARRAFEREALLLAKLRHQALPSVIDHFNENGGQFLVMEFIAGPDLGQLVERHADRFRAPAALPDVLRWADELLDALEYLHSQQPPIIHGDIKPHNLKLLPNGCMVLLDFGVARQGRGVTSTRRTTNQSTKLVRDQSLIGFTYDYAPLEQRRGANPDPRNDLYALGATLTHLLTGHRPPDADSRVAALWDGRSDPLHEMHWGRHMPPRLIQLLQQAMSLTVKLRPASARMLRQDLAAVRNGKLTPVPLAEPPVVAPHRLHTNGATVPTPPPWSPPPVPDLQPLKALDTPRLTLPNGSPVTALAVGASGVAAAGCEDASITLWRINDGANLGRLRGTRDGVCDIAFSADGQVLATTSADNVVHFWSAAQQRALRPLCPWPNAIECIAFSPCGRLFAIGGWGDYVGLWRTDEAGLTQVGALTSAAALSLAFSPDSRLLAVGDYDGSIVLWRLDTCQPVGLVPSFLRSTFVTDLAFSPDGRLLAAGGANGVVLLRDVRERRHLDQFEGHTKSVRSIAWSPNGEAVISGSEDGSVRLWRVRDGSLIGAPIHHPQGVSGVALLADGRTLITACRDTKLRVWSLGTPEQR